MSEASKQTEAESPARSRSRRKYAAALIVSVLILGGGGWLGYRWKIADLESRSREAANNRDWKALEESARAWTTWVPDSTEAWVFRADAAQQQQRFLEAAEHLGQIAPDSPGYVDARVARCQLFFGPCNRPLLGESDCLQVLEQHPKVPEIYRMLIDYYAITMQRSKFRNTIRKAIEVQCEPRSAYAYLFMSETLRLGPAFRIVSLWLNESSDSELLTAAHALQKEDRIIHTEQGTTRDRDAPSEKVARVRQLLEKYPHNLNLISYDIHHRIVAGDIDAVVELINAAGEAGQDDNRFWRHRGWVHLTDTDFEAAETACRRALELHPQDFLCMQRLSEVLRIHQQPDEAARLQDLVLRANELRNMITDFGSVTTLPDNVLRRLAQWVRDAGDEAVADALFQRLDVQADSKRMSGGTP